jgi:anti-sigma factor RsiW
LSNEPAHVPYEALARLVAGTIDPDEKADVERHLAECAYCQRDLDDALAWKGQMAALPPAQGANKGLVLVWVGVGLLVAAALIGFVILWPW